MPTTVQTRICRLYDAPQDTSNSPTGSRFDGIFSPTDNELPQNRIASAGEYDLLHQLGRGGMGIVYLAYQRRLKRNVAYKVLTQLTCLDLEALERFQGEAELLAQLQHPNIVQVFDFGAYENTPYLAMEYLPGGSLAERLRRQRPTPLESADLIETIARAVGYAHSRHIIHRDLNPGNILLSDDGRPKVSDFGLARHLANERLTRTGTVAGTPQYMAPEQVVGSKDFTPAVDVWALGAMLYEMIAGTTPFAGDETQDVYHHVLHHEAVSLRAWQPSLARDLETICLKCLHKEPERRYIDANELADDLRRFLDRRTIRARPVGTIEKSVRWCRRNPLVASLTFGVAILLLAVSAVSLLFAEWAIREQARSVVAAKSEADLRQKAEEAVEAEKTALADQTKARKEAEVMTGVLNALLGSVQPGNDVLGGLRRQLDKTAAQLKQSNDDPILKAQLFHALAMTRRRLGDYAQAVELMEQSFALRKKFLGEDHPVFRKTAHDLSYTYIHAHRGEAAIRVLQATYDRELAETPLDSEHMIFLLSEMRRAYDTAGRHDDNERLGDRIIAISQKLYGTDDVKTHWARASLASLYRQRKQYDRAIPILKTALSRFYAECSPTSAEVVWTRLTLGLCYLETDRPEEAIPYLRAANDHNLAISGPTHPLTLESKAYLARAYELAGKFPEALPLRRGLQEHYRSVGNSKAADFNAERVREVLTAIPK